MAKEIGPDRIQLNTVVRPPAEEFAAAVSAERMQSLCPLFDPPAEIIADFATARSDAIVVTEATILAMLRRRPCTMEQIAGAFNLHVNEVSKYLGKLIGENAVRTVRKNATIYYSAIFSSEDLANNL